MKGRSSVAALHFFSICVELCTLNFFRPRLRPSLVLLIQLGVLAGQRDLMAVDE